jgi:hypothetical protein
MIGGGGQSPPASFENDAQIDAAITHRKGRKAPPSFGLNMGKPHTPCRPFATLRVGPKAVVRVGFNATGGFEQFNATLLSIGGCI